MRLDFTLGWFFILNSPTEPKALEIKFPVVFQQSNWHSTIDRGEIKNTVSPKDGVGIFPNVTIEVELLKVLYRICYIAPNSVMDKK